MNVDEIRRLIDELCGPDEDTSMNAMDRLTAAGAPAVEPLLAVIADRGESEGNPSIFRTHQSWDGAVVVLGKIGDPRAVEPLLAAYRDFAAHNWPTGWSTRSTLARALARIDDPRARALVKEVAANDPIESIRADLALVLKAFPSAT